MNTDSPWYPLFNLLPTPFPYCGESSASWIHDPVDTWSSFLYLVAAYWIYQKSRRLEDSPLKSFYLIPVIITFGSILFHTSFTYIFLMADFFGIYTLNFFCMGLNRVRLGGTDNRHVFIKSIGFSAIWTFSMLLTHHFKLSSGFTMIPPIITTLILELRCFKSEQNTQYKNFFIAGTFITAGYVMMLLEGKPWHIGCDGQYMQLHTWWHLLSALSMVFIFKFYLQFYRSIDKKLS
ncbi:MAG: hypothetical protein EP319_16590 [Deltaproteobacteria bacterium]|nr:MAG: hypothetical protein EP319_16590 [Deltaproteobacteria bacterium]